MASKSQDWVGPTSRTESTKNRVSSWVLVQGKRVLKSLVYSSAYLAIIAMVEVLIVSYLLSLPPSPAPIVVGLITFAVYANDRLVDLESDAASNPYRTAFVRRYQNVLYVFAAIAYGLAVALSVYGGPIAFGLVLIPAIVWVLYAIEWVPSTNTSFQRLKDLLIVDSVIIAIAWSLAIVGLPLAFANAAVNPTVGIIFLYFVLATIVNTEIANVSDIQTDKEAGVATMPVVFGVRRTRQALYGVILLAVVTLGYAVFNGFLTGRYAAILSVGLACLTVVTVCLNRIEQGTLLTIAAECTRLPVFVLLAIPIIV